MSNKKISELPSYRVYESGFTDMAVTVPIPGTSVQQVRRVHIGEHCCINMDDAIDKIKEIYRSGKVPFILPVKL